jgi:hypothetical protein
MTTKQPYGSDGIQFWGEASQMPKIEVEDSLSQNQN